MRRFLLLPLLYLSVSIWGQSYPVGKRTIQFIDASRSNRVIPTDVYYPGLSAGTNVPLSSGTDKFPVVVFGHGFLMPVSAYAWLADSLVKYGFILALPSTEAGITPNHEQLGRDMAFLCQRITSLNDSSASFLFGRVMNKSAAGGHSMGGGSSFLAMTYQPAINALFNFAAAETNPSASAAALIVQRPTLIFSGGGDCIVAPSVQQGMYNNIPYPCKTRININNALHCQFGNNDATCVLGQISSGCNSSSITAPVVFQKTCQLLVPFLQHYLKSDCIAKQTFETNYASLTGAEKERTCGSDPQGCLVTAVYTPTQNESIRVFPNPAPPHSLIRVETTGQPLDEFWLEDATGRRLHSYTIQRSAQFSFYLHKSGLYLLRGRQGRRSFTRILTAL